MLFRQYKFPTIKDHMVLYFSSLSPLLILTDGLPNFFYFDILKLIDKVIIKIKNIKLDF